MDMQFLREQAFALRDFLRGHGLPLKHGQILDLLASLPGLRNWPEVNAFPGKVAAATLDLKAAERLARRVAASGGPPLVPADLLAVLLRDGKQQELRVWPEGPAPGIYVTIDKARAEAAIARYADAAHEAIFYTEGIGFEADGAIELGEAGIYSRGLQRIASGTLVVVGPMDLVQANWEENKSKLIAAANAVDSGARVVLYCRTPEPAHLHGDLANLMREPGGGLQLDPTLAGAVAEDGSLNRVHPFVHTLRSVSPGAVFAPVVEPWPRAVSEPVLAALRRRPTGVLLASTDAKSSSEALRLRTAAALLPDVTALLGPAARVLESFSPGYDRKPDRDLLEQLPTVPSVQAALDAGYKVIVCESPYHGSMEALVQNADAACYVITARAMWAGRAFDHTAGLANEAEGLFNVLNAIVSWTDIKAGKKGELRELWDVYIHDASKKLPARALSNGEDFVQRHRYVRWEDQVLAMLARGELARQKVRTIFPYLKLPERIARETASQ